MDEVATGADDEKPTIGTQEMIGDEGSEPGLPADLEREVAELRRRLIDTPRELHRLESEVRDVKRELARANACLLYTSPSPRDKRQSRMPSSA